MDFPTVFVRKRKRPSGTGTWSAYVIAEDEHGTWLFSPKGSLFRGEKDGEIVGIVQVAQGDRGEGRDALHLVPRHEKWWFTAWGNFDDTLTVDICLPMTFDGTTWEYVDLEIDLWAVPSTGDVGVVDEDEFEEACAAGHIPPTDRQPALAATAELRGLIEAKQAPFNEMGFERLAAAGALCLPPLVDLP